MFKKADQKKNRLELVDPEYIEGIGAVLTFGSKKYAPNNWKLATQEDIERIHGAILRHQMAIMKGEEIDPDSGLLHAYHLGCNAMFLAYHTRNRREHLNQSVMVFDEDGGID